MQERMRLGIHAIDDMDEEYQERDIIYGEYIIGNYVVLNCNDIIVGCSVSPKAFFSFDFDIINKYLVSGSFCFRLENYRSDADIIQNFSNTLYGNIVIKTYWIRLVQRHWKKICAIKKRMIQNQIRSLKERETRGTSWLRNIPRLKGMLSIYATTKSQFQRQSVRTQPFVEP